MTWMEKAKARARGWRLGVWSGLVCALAMQPALGVLWSARSAQASDEETAEQARKRVLASIPTDASVLINVTSEDMPASPDILNLGKRGTPALERCLADNADASIRETCAVLLGRLGDRRALPTLQAALADWEPSVRTRVIQALRQIPDPSSFTPLSSLVGRKDEEVHNRSLALEALGALSDRRAVQLLRAEMKRKPNRDRGEPNFRSEAFDALWASRHLMARETLVGDVAEALASDDRGLVLRAAYASAELRSPRLVGALTPLLEAPEEQIRNRAAYALGRIGDRTATAALLARLPHVREARMLNNIAFALERLDPKAFFGAIRQLAEHKQAVIRLNAAFVIGDVRRPEGLPLLQKSLQDPSDYVKTSSIAAMGKLGVPEAVSVLEPLLQHPSLAIREEAIYAVHELSGNKRADLIFDELFSNRKVDARARHRAAVALAKIGDARVRDYFLECMDQRRCQTGEFDDFLRADTHAATGERVLLAWARGDQRLAELVADTRPRGALSIASSIVDCWQARRAPQWARGAIDVMGDLGDRSATARLRPSTGATDTWMRLHAAVALARLGDDSALPLLMAEFDNAPADWLPGFAAVLSQIEEPAVRAKLVPALVQRERGADVDRAIACASVRLRWDPDQAIFRLLDGLASPAVRERELAVAALERDTAKRVTWLLRRALARENRPFVRDALRMLLDSRGP